MSEIIPLLRHALQVGAGILVARGFLDDATGEMLIGGVVSIATVAWYLYNKHTGRAI